MHSTLLRRRAFPFTTLNEATILFESISQLHIITDKPRCESDKNEHLQSSPPSLFSQPSENHDSPQCANSKTNPSGNSSHIQRTDSHVFVDNGPHNPHTRWTRVPPYAAARNSASPRLRSWLCPGDEAVWSVLEVLMMLEKRILPGSRAETGRLEGRLRDLGIAWTWFELSLLSFYY